MNYSDPRQISPDVLSSTKMARTFYNRLQSQIQDALNQLRDDEQLALYYHGQGGEPIVIAKLGYHNPNLIQLYGRNARDEECVVLAHMNSVQLVMVVEKTDMRSPKRAIGFIGESSPEATDEEAQK